MKQNTPHFLIWGAKGFIGAKAIDYFSSLGDCDFVARNANGKLNFFNAVTQTIYDLPNSDESLQQILNNTSADVVLNAAAKADIDFCSAHPAAARVSNVELPEKLAFYTKQAGKYFVHLSTDAVFGQTNSMHAENVSPRPLSIYGKMKLESELAVLSLRPDALIIRTRPFGNDSNGKNLFNFFADSLINCQAVNGYINSFFTPIYVSDLFMAIDTIVRDKAYGIWHIAGSERISKHEFGTLVARHLQVDPKLVKPVKYEVKDANSARGLDTSLNTQKFTAIYGTVNSMDSGILQSVNELTS